jgi:hypothetical protein
LGTILRRGFLKSVATAATVGVATDAYAREDDCPKSVVFILGPVEDDPFVTVVTNHMSQSRRKTWHYCYSLGDRPVECDDDATIYELSTDAVEDLQQKAIDRHIGWSDLNEQQKHFIRSME